MATRTRSQQPSFNQIANSTSPQKGFKTRVVYKNAQVEEDDVGMRSLYGQSFNRTTQSRNSQRSNQKTSESARVTLADIGAIHRMNSSRGQLERVKTGDLASPKGSVKINKKVQQEQQPNQKPVQTSQPSKQEKGER